MNKQDINTHLYLKKLEKRARNKGILIGLGAAVFGPTVLSAICKRGALEWLKTSLRASQTYYGVDRAKEEEEMDI